MCSFGRTTALVVPALALLTLLPAAYAAPQHGLETDQRTIFGTVTDGREPLRNAVVELKNPATNSVTSFLTGDTGYYVFKHLNSHADLSVSATFRGRTSHVHTISMFDAHLQKKIDLKIVLDR